MRAYVGADPVTGERVDLGGMASNRWDAEKLLTRFLAEKDAWSARRPGHLGEALDQWLDGLDIEAKTGHEYAGYVRRTIKPALGNVPLSKLNARGIESLYAQLRRCRRLCRDPRGLIDHQTAREHTCDERLRRLLEPTGTPCHAGQFSRAVDSDAVAARPGSMTCPRRHLFRTRPAARLP